MEEGEGSSGEHDHEKGQDLRNGEEVADGGSLAGAESVNQRENSNEDGQDEEARPGLFCGGPEFGKVDDEQVCIRSRSCCLGEVEHPADENSGEAAEGGAGVEIGAPGIGELRGYLGVAGHNHAHGGSGEEDGGDAALAEKGGYGGGEAEDAAADDRIDGQSGQAPTADSSHETGLRRGHG